jgi:hypothetical protein
MSTENKEELAECVDETLKLLGVEPVGTLVQRVFAIRIGVFNLKKEALQMAQKHDKDFKEQHEAFAKVYGDIQKQEQMLRDALEASNDVKL